MSRAHSERGLSLLEVMVATSLVLGSLFATVAAMDSGVQAATAADRRVQATALATSDIETLRSMPYERIGLAAGTAGFVPRFEGADTVEVDAPAFEPTAEVGANGTTFRIVRHVTWATVSPTGGTDIIGGYKHLVVDVSWPGPRGGSVRVDSAVSPYYQAQPCAQRWVDESEAELGGVVNAYYPGSGPVAADAEQIRVGAARGSGRVIAGDVVLVIQMEGPDAGTYEYALATNDPSGGMLSVTGRGAAGGLVHAYGATGRFQVVRVASNGVTSIVDPVVPLKWDGSVGGVVAIDAPTQLDLSAGIDASNAGIDIDRPVGFVTSLTRLLPGGSSSGSGGGLVLVRAAQLGSGGFIDAHGDGGGGTVVLLAETGGLETVGIDASGRAVGASPGAVLTSTSPGGVTTGGADGTPGTMISNVWPDRLDGHGVDAGCLPAVSVTVSTLTPAVSTAGGATPARFRIDVVNRTGRGTATGLAISAVLPGGVQFASGTGVKLSGGATFDGGVKPSAGDTTPRWGTFTVPPGGGITFEVTVVVTLDTAPGAATNVVRAAYTSRAGAAVAVASDSALTVSRFSCPVPWTDDAPTGGISGLLNGYYPVAATVSSGSTMVMVGAPTGNSTPISAGDLLLISRWDAATGPSATDYEYVVAASTDVDGRVRVSGSGPGGGVVADYPVSTDAASPSAGGAQLIRVPTYGDTHLDGTVVGQAWNGSTGGVVAFDVAGTLDLAGGSVDLDGLGSAGAGGLTVIRSALVAGTGTITASGSPGGAGGTVVVASAIGSTPGLTALARGSGAPGGVVLLPALNNSTDVGGSTPGTVGTIASSALSGALLGVGCRPMLTVTPTTATPTRYRVSGQTATWTVTVAALPDRPTVRDVAVFASPPKGFEFSGTRSVVLGGGAVRTPEVEPSSSDPLTWGSFDLPGGSVVSITFDTKIAAGAGRYDLPVVVRGAGPDGNVGGGYSGSEFDMDDVSILDVVSPRVMARSVVDRLTGGSATTGFALDDVDDVTWTSGSLPAAPNDARPIDIVQSTGLFLPTAMEFPGATVRTQLRFAAATAGDTVCAYGQVVRSSSGQVLSTVGSSSAPIGCVTGTTPAAFDVAVVDPNGAPIVWTGAILDDLRLRIIGWSSGAGPIVLDRAGLTRSWAGVDVAMQTASVIDATSGSPISALVNQLSGPVAATSFDVGPAPIGVTFSPSRFVDLQFPSVVPDGSTASSAALTLRWAASSTSRVCWYAEVRVDSTILGTIGGTSAAPFCRDDASTAQTDSFELPAGTIERARPVTIRMYAVVTAGSAPTLRFEQATMAIGWGRS